MASEPEYWSYTPALRESAEQKVEVRLWTHKGNAILQDVVDGTVVADRRCTGQSYVHSLAAAFSYRPTDDSEWAYYAIWRDSQQREVSINRVTVESQKEELGVTELRGLVVWAGQEGNEHVQVFAPDRELLFQAMEALRPTVKLLDALP